MSLSLLMKEMRIILFDMVGYRPRTYTTVSTGTIDGHRRFPNSKGQALVSIMSAISEIEGSTLLPLAGVFSSFGLFASELSSSLSPLPG